MKSKVNILIIALVVIIVIIGAVLIFGGSSPVDEPVVEEETIDTVGTVTYVDLEGGFFGIISVDGYQYFPINLDESLQEDGLEIEFLANIDEDYVDVYMWGLPIEIVEASALEASEEPEPELEPELELNPELDPEPEPEI
jgi:hypothetical protein